MPEILTKKSEYIEIVKANLHKQQDIQKENHQQTLGPLKEKYEALSRQLYEKKKEFEESKKKNAALPYHKDVQKHQK